MEENTPSPSDAPPPVVVVPSSRPRADMATRHLAPFTSQFGAQKLERVAAAIQAGAPGSAVLRDNSSGMAVSVMRGAARRFSALMPSRYRVSETC